MLTQEHVFLGKITVTVKDFLKAPCMPKFNYNNNYISVVASVVYNRNIIQGFCGVLKKV